MATVEPIPEGFHRVTPHLVVAGAAAAIDFYKKAFGAEELHRALTPDGKKVMHATVRIGDSMVMLADDFPEFGGKPRTPNVLGGTTVTLNLNVTDTDAAIKQAAAAGATVTMPATDMFWGDRYGKVLDAFGHEWSFATHVRDVTPEELNEAAKKFFS